MNNLPDAPDLLHIARETLLTQLQPLAPPHARYALAMVANAMAIAAREAEAGEVPALAALTRLDALYGRPARALAGAALQQALADGERVLAADIRAGRFDACDSRHAALLAHLHASVAARLCISNPKRLEA